MGARFEILVVCTANVCRSPLAERVISSRLTDAAHDGLMAEHLASVHSAGTDAQPGDPMCPQSAAMVHVVPQEHRAVLITRDLLERAGLILTADVGQRGVCARMVPACRPRLFTLTQAAAIAQQLAATIEAGQLPDGAAPLPDDPEDRLRWFVTELDAGRGSMAGMPEGYEDIVDDHGGHDHAATLRQVEVAATTLADAIASVLRAADAATQR